MLDSPPQPMALPPPPADELWGPTLPAYRQEQALVRLEEQLQATATELRETLGPAQSHAWLERRALRCESELRELLQVIRSFSGVLPQEAEIEQVMELPLDLMYGF